MSNTTAKKVPTELGTEKIGKLLAQYAIPAIIAQIAASLYNLIDRAFIGHIPNVGTDAISGLTNTFPFMNLSVAFGAMIGVGGATLLSVRLGQRDYDSARNILGNLVTLNVIVGLLFAAVSFLFIDEIHRLSPVVEEYLYSAMEDYVIDIMIDKGPGARSVRISLNPFTLVGATTRSGLLTSPLRARFGITCAMEYYDTLTLVNIVKRSASILKVSIDQDAAYEIALRSRGTPRIANALLRRVRDFAQVMGNGNVDLQIARFALDALNIDKRGLDAIDNKILKTIITKFKGGPVGANTIATAVGEDQGTLEEVYEPFLIKEGFI